MDASRPRLTALVPMRHHSERVPEKNYRQVAGRPLYAYILETLLGCAHIHQVVVDTDSPVIWQGVERAFPSVQLIERPLHLREESLSMNEVLLHDVATVPSDFYLQTHSTNPLLTAGTIQRAIKAYFQAYPQSDSLFSVTRRPVRFWDEQGGAVNHDPTVLLRTQDMQPLFEENSCLYIFEAQTFQRGRNRIGERPQMFEIDRLEAWDIDDLIDLFIVEQLLRRSSDQAARPG